MFYVDDVVLGTTFEREGFKCMMTDVEAGKVGTVITKDLSRLGRDYLKTGELTAFIETAEQKSADVTAFIQVVQKYEHITELTPEIMHELIEKIVVHAPNKSSGHRTQQIEIHYRFNVAVTTAVADSKKVRQKKKGCVTNMLRNLIFKNLKLRY